MCLDFIGVGCLSMCLDLLGVDACWMVELLGECSNPFSSQNEHNHWLLCFVQDVDL